LAIDEVLGAASVLEELPHTGKAQQFLRAQHGMGWPGFFLDLLDQIIAHAQDLFVHTFSGGTYPFDIHEILFVTYGPMDLGYDLV